MAIYTKKGDDLKTDLIGEIRVFKDELRVETYGTLDELSAVLGVARAEVSDQGTEETIYKLQEKLQIIASIIADPHNSLKLAVTESDIASIEEEIDRYNSLIPPVQSFVVSGDYKTAAILHQARTVGRRAERNLVRLARQEQLDRAVAIYLNRLSDLLFVLAQWEHFRNQVKDVVLRVLREHQRCEKSVKEDNMSLSLEQAKTILQKAEKKATELKVPMTIALVDDGGNTVAIHRMDGALLASLDIARGKAYTAFSLRMSTAELSELVKPGQPLYGIENTNQGQIVIFGGGMPVISKGTVIGGLGVSGGSVEEDIEVAKYALEDF